MTSDGCWPADPRSQLRARSFDGQVSIECEVERPDRYQSFARTGTQQPAIARGAGLSYAAASFGAGAVTVDMSAFDRILAYDERTGRVEVEAGINVGVLFHFLLARGRYLPVLPGHGRISIGGCVAADVHGKNQSRDGNFSRHVVRLALFHPAHGVVNMSRSDHASVFGATCGGFGATGVILKVTLQTQLLPGRIVEVEHIPIDSVSQGITALRAVALEHDLAYSWHDFSRRGAGFGRGYVAAGKFIAGAAPLGRTPHPPTLRSRPAGPCLYTPLTIRALNAAHGAARRGNIRRLSLEQAMFPIHGAGMYFRAFGCQGFHEYQALVPFERLDDYVDGVSEAIQKHGVLITLASAKVFSGRSTALRFDGEGVCFAINLTRTPSSRAFLGEIDKLLLQIGGRPNLIKDSRLGRDVAQAAFPDIDRVRSVLREWDPQRYFRSELTERLGL